MIVLGINGGINKVNENPFQSEVIENHDASAVLIRDGRIIAAFEEERLNRIKHTNKSPLLAMKACLDMHGIKASDIDVVAISMEEETMDNQMLSLHLYHPQFPFTSARSYLQHVFQEQFGTSISADKFKFVNHHLAHAASTFYLSGFDKAIVLTIDGAGDNLSGAVCSGDGNGLKMLKPIPESLSLGHYYLAVTKMFGYKMFDEYKVMGLAPYGDPHRLQSLFETTYKLLPHGEYDLYFDKLGAIEKLCPKPDREKRFDQLQMDIAASLQMTLEKIVLHMATHLRATTGYAKLCLAGGVAHNCSMMGKLLYANLFDDIFVQPASNDGGIALGAALYQYFDAKGDGVRETLSNVYLGSRWSDVEFDCQVNAWEDFFRIRKSDDVCKVAAQAIADGKVIGWFQGRSEFGPRALGNRSILGDPRPAYNKDRINEIVKKREGYRPFAPSLKEEAVQLYYETSGKARFPFMSFTLQTKKEYHSLLGAVTHVDGSARVQTVSAKDNPMYWRLLDEFEAITGLPVLLNTSFNNHAEPIVDSPTDAIVCFLTTGLDCLFVHDYVLEKKEITTTQWLEMTLELPPYVYLKGGDSTSDFVLANSFSETELYVDKNVYAVLAQADGSTDIAELLERAGVDQHHHASILEKIFDLWSLRLVRLAPMPISVQQNLAC